MIYSTTEKTKCDVKDCKNMATWYVAVKGKSGKLFLCEECRDKLYKEAIATHTPKSPKNTIKKIIDRKAEEEIG